MSNDVYKQIELTGCSSNTLEEAIQNAVAKASQTLRQVSWFEVVETRGSIVDGKVDEFQVTVKIGFKLEADSSVG